MTTTFSDTKTSNGIEKHRTARVLVPSSPPPVLKEGNYKAFCILIHSKCEEAIGMQRTVAKRLRIWV